MYLQAKRFIDIFCSSIALLLLCPILILIGILLKFSAEGEIFYKQERLGYKNRLFGILKFATMLKDSPNLGNKTVTVRNDPRITLIGKYLRYSKVNELPQIINVLMGQMSFVGPRPLLTTSVKKYVKEVQDVIYLNRPGITGLGSLVFRDEERLVTAYKNTGGDPLDFYKDFIYPYKGQLELWYYHNQSFLVDVKILFLTFWSLIDSRSDLVYRWLPNIPKRPKTLF
jgi:lipopolysaccharide/colanic/teichoic acid biosynthesis glycosyltransferase